VFLNNTNETDIKKKKKKNPYRIGLTCKLNPTTKPKYNLQQQIEITQPISASNNPTTISTLTKQTNIKPLLKA